MKIDKAVLGIAGELAVASELCRRNIYAQLTFGNQKRTDLLVCHAGGYARIEVKCKQGDDWPNCKGIDSSDAFLVFVDFAGKGETQRPDFYVLTYKDWLKLLKNKKKNCLKKSPNRKIEINNGCLYFLDQVNKSGKPYAGCGVRPTDLEKHHEKWEKIKLLIKERFEPDTSVED